jgi:prolyl-tRNA synthetase
MAPTAEEAMVEFAREKLKSYKHLPVNFYQIGEKYRHEIRTRGYMLRGKSFLMMDAYSFDENLEGLEKNYEITRQAYLNISKRLGINAIPVVADNGAMGGKKSEEFMVISPIGEDTILFDEKTGIGLNTEILEKENYEEYLKTEYGIEDISNLQEKKTIEIGHIFQLGTRYSETMNATFTSREGKQEPYFMGCYGIGVSRVMAAIYENSAIKDENGNVIGISLPMSVAPYRVQIIPKVESEERLKQATEFYDKMNGKAILDDRDKVSIGAKIKDASIFGTPYVAIMGDKVEDGKMELENTLTGEKQVLSIDEAVNFLNNQ